MDEQLTHADLERYRRQLMLHGFTVDSSETAQELQRAGCRRRGPGRHRRALSGRRGHRQACPGARRKCDALEHEPADPDEEPDRQEQGRPGEKDDPGNEPGTVRSRSSMTGSRTRMPPLLRSTRFRSRCRRGPNFEERRTLNKACVEKGIPMVEAAMNGMEGYIFNVIPRVASCVHCVYPEDDPSWKELGFPGARRGLGHARLHHGHWRRSSC